MRCIATKNLEYIHVQMVWIIRYAICKEKYLRLLFECFQHTKLQRKVCKCNIKIVISIPVGDSFIVQLLLLQNVPCMARQLVKEIYHKCLLNKFEFS